MKRTEILCPDCMKKKLLDTGEEIKGCPKLRCDNCGTEFIQTGKRTVNFL